MGTGVSRAVARASAATAMIKTRIGQRHSLAKTASVSESIGADYVEHVPERIVLPLYVYPSSDSPVYERIGRDMKQLAGKLDVVINPNNGKDAILPPNADFECGLNQIRNGARDCFTPMLGYVFTKYGRRPSAEVKNEIQGYATYWKEWIGGIFFDEVSSDTAAIEIYRDFCEFSRSLGLSVVFLNPGVPLQSSAWMCCDADSIVTHEDIGLEKVRSLEMTQLGVPCNRCNFSMLALGIESRGDIHLVLDTAKRHGFGRIFMSNFHDYHTGLPVYWDLLIQTLSSQT